MGVFQNTVEAFAPAWFQRTWMRILLRAVASAYDEMAQRVYDGMRAAIPYSAQGAAPRILDAIHGGGGIVWLVLDTSAPLTNVQEIWIYSAETTGGLVLDGTWKIRVVSPTEIELQGSSFVGAYVGGAILSYVGLRQCDVDVLGRHGGDRGIRLYSSEPELSKRYRLSRWRQLKKRRGSHLGELENLQPFWLSTLAATLPTMRIVFQDGYHLGPAAIWYTIDSLGRLTIHTETTSNWDYDGQTTKRARFWLIIYLPPGYSSAIEYDDGASVYDGGAIYDGITTLAIADIVAAVKEAKAAHSRLAAVIVTTLQPGDTVPGVAGVHRPFDPTDTAQTSADGWTTLPVGNWGNLVDPVTGLPTRPPWASWVYEDNP